MSDEQLQLFDVPAHPAHRRRGFTSVGQATLRHDHAVLLAMTALIIASVVFAFGVERGKRLARTEQSASMAEALPAPEPVTNSQPVAAPMAPAVKPVPSKPAKLAPKASKLASKESNFAVQVVSYSQARFAQQELQQLQRQGEKAFLMQQQGRTTLLIGPFPTKAHAVDKLLTLRQRYQGCFIRAL